MLEAREPRPPVIPIDVRSREPSVSVKGGPAVQYALVVKDDDLPRAHREPPLVARVARQLRHLAERIVETRHFVKGNVPKRCAIVIVEPKRERMTCHVINGEERRAGGRKHANAVLLRDRDV